MRGRGIELKGMARDKRGGRTKEGLERGKKECLNRMERVGRAESTRSWCTGW